MNKNILALAMGTFAATGASAAVVHVTADITSDTLWVASNEYVLETVTYVRNGATLDIAPGTIVRGQPGTSSLVAGSLVVRPDSKIQIRGTSAEPVIFTTAAVDVNDDGNVDYVDTNPAPETTTNQLVRWESATHGATNFWDATPATVVKSPVSTDTGWQGGKNMAMWGGIILIGDALTNNGNQTTTNVGLIEDGKGMVEGLDSLDGIYGGSEANHSSGSIKYVSIRHGGIGLSANKEINALTFYAVGAKTTVENVDIYCTSDDGVEVFGGGVSMKNININYADDDGFDVDEGWNGVAQFVFVLQGRGYGDHGLELDGEDKAENQAPLSNEIYPLPDSRLLNFTVWKARTSSGADRGANIKEGFSGMIANSIFQAIEGVSAEGLVFQSGSTVSLIPYPADNIKSGLFQIRNVSMVGFTTNYSAVTGLGTELSISATGAVTGQFAGLAVPNAFYPATLNRNNLQVYGTTGVLSVDQTAQDSVNPRPSLTSAAYGVPLDAAYLPAPAVTVGYRGAFDRTAATLWTTGWTALNDAGILVD